MERTLVLVKPDAMLKGYGGAIVGRLQEQGLKLIGLKMIQIDRVLAEQHYAAHRARDFFGELIEYIISTPVIAAAFQGEDAINKARDAMGATDPAKAKSGTIRKDFGTDIQRNAVHGSDAPESGEREIKLYFKANELFNY